MAHAIYDRNQDFLHRVPLEEFVEHLVRALREELQQLRNEERKTMATVEATQQALTRYQAAVDARETSEEAKIADLEAGVVPDSLVQSINDAAAKIEAQNAGLPAAGTGSAGAGSGTGDAGAGSGTGTGTGAGTGDAGAGTGDAGAGTGGQGSTEATP